MSSVTVADDTNEEYVTTSMRIPDEQAIGGVAGHELVHATDAKEINRDIRHEIKNGTPRNDREVLPNKVEQEIIEQSKTLNKQ